MKKMLWIILCVFSVSSMIFAAREENLIMNGDFEQDSNGWHFFKGVAISSKAPEKGKKCLSTNKSLAEFYGKKTIEIDPDAFYTFSASVKGEGSAYIGFVAYNGRKKPIYAKNVDYYAGTQTTLALAAKAGDRFIKIKDGKRWRKYAFAYVAFNTDKNLKDLPNTVLSARDIKSVEQKDDCWEVTLAKPLSKSYPVGTKIREHRGSARWMAFMPIAVNSRQISDD